ncbi:iron ABC transporter permease [Segatella salivae]|uniref:iron ABC transporter permease n=1 Tax=Segatella salivae TaxID=228604 RepID=UPI001CAF31FE|nr:iron ABC transporter permease [Segatella salivae]MBF1556231.1 iron ABC transporter permease [Segatella salivae]
MGKKGIRYCILMCGCIIILLILNLIMGSVSIPFSTTLHVIFPFLHDEVTSNLLAIHPSWEYIIMESRLPQALTALLTGAALSACGLLLQTAFRNPLAGPGIFGISSGAGLGVALVMLLLGGSVTTAAFSVSGFLAILLAAFVGAMLITLLLFFFSSMVRSSILLLIIGIMVGYVANSIISILNFYATEEGVKSYLVWGLGNFGGVSMAQMPLFASIVLLGLLTALLMMKPLNALLLGEQYAENLGINVQRTRNFLLIITGLLMAITTAFCGPIVFIGLAVPHIARLLLNTDNHLSLLPATMMTGSAVALLCNLLCILPGELGILPLNAVTPLLGAPIIIYVIMKNK